MTTTPVEELAEAFVALADAAADEPGSEGFLNLIADRCVRLLGVSAAGLSLVDEDGGTRAVGASGARARALVLLDDGPGQDCRRTGEPVGIADLDATTTRWPAFCASATAAGFAAAHAVPMRRRADVFGALTLFGTVPGPLDRVTARIAQALADLVTIRLAQIRALRRQADVTAQLQHALTSRVLIEQAKGITGERLGLGMEAAFDLLRKYARSNNRRLTELAEAVVDGSFDTRLLALKPDKRTAASSPPYITKESPG